MDGIKYSLRPQRLERESAQMWRAFQDFMNLPEYRRTLVNLIDIYTDKNAVDPPTTKYNTLKSWSSKNKWTDRIESAQKTQNKIAQQVEAEVFVSHFEAASQEKGRQMAAELQNYRDKLTIIGKTGISIAANCAKITERMAKAIADNDPVMPYSDGDLQRMLMVAQIHRSLFTQAVPVASETLGMALGVNEILLEMIGKRNAA